MIKDNITTILQSVREASGGDEVTLVAVTKRRSVEEIQQVYDAGIRDMGENRVQEWRDKHPALPEDIRWHLIGHLQTNKVKYLIGKVYLIHSVDSVRLAEEIAAQSVKKGVQTNVLLQINIAREEQKSGFDIEEIFDAAEMISQMPGLGVKGLMCMAPFEAEGAALEGYFTKMAEIFREMKLLYKEKSGIIEHNVDMKYLSMGMSGDYLTAIRCGANVVRIGTAIFV